MRVTSSPSCATSRGPEMRGAGPEVPAAKRSEEHTSELQSQSNLVCRLLLEKKKNITIAGARGRRVGVGDIATPEPARAKGGLVETIPSTPLLDDVLHASSHVVSAGIAVVST